MRPVLFVICFSVGVGLMVISGYLPKAASAGDGTHEAADTAPGGAGSLSNVQQSYQPNIPLAGPGATGLSVAGRTTKAGDSSASIWTSNETDIDGNAEVPADGVTDTGAPATAAGETPESVPTAEPDDSAATITAEGADAAPDESSSDSAPGSLPTADAGPDRIVWAGWNELSLDGKASHGDGLTHAWKQVGGPVPLKIKQAHKATTAASGLSVNAEMDWSPALYQFELTVVDQHGKKATDTVEFVVLSAPELTITPHARRRFETRDGYPLGHFEAWATNTETYESAFKIASPTALTFTKVTGGDYDLSGGKADGGYVYYVVVFQQSGETTSWLEFLVDTDEKIPGIIQLGVNWYGR